MLPIRCRWFAVGLTVLLLTDAASAERELSTYERSVLVELEAAVGSGREPEPEGKRIEEVIVYRLGVFDHRDPVPDFVNLLHVKTREPVIVRELLVGVGRPFAAALAAESERNLRQLQQFSLVLVVPLRGSTPDRVRLAVVTKDIWSLRAAWDPRITRDGLVSSPVALDEINLAGRLKTLSLRGGFDPQSLWYGVRYIDPRVAASRNFLLVGAQWISDRETGEAQGSFGNLWYGQDLYSVDTRWAYDSFVAWRDDVEVSYVGGRPRTFDALGTPEDDAYPVAWERGLYFARYEVWRSFGTQYKLDLGVGVELSRGEYSPADRGAAPAAVREEFVARELPPSHQRVGPVVALRAHSTRFLRTLDVNTLALQEDISLGHDLSLRLYPTSRALGSTRTLLGVAAFAGYTEALGDGFVRGRLGSISEHAGAAESDAWLEAQLHIVSPRLGFGRVVMDAIVADRYRDFHRDRFTIGGEDRLRGYPIGWARGSDLAAGTVEIRTTSLGFWGIGVGGAAFYDVAAAPARLRALSPRASVGAGVRLLLPMFNRATFRLDVGFPLRREPGAGERPWGLFMGFEPSVPTPSVRRSPIPGALLP